MGEVYDYTKSDTLKQLTKENIYSSIYTVGIETEKGAILGNLHPVTATIGNITIDKIATGEGNVWKNISMSGIGYAIDSSISNNPFVKENLLKVSEKISEKFSNDSGTQK